MASEISQNQIDQIVKLKNELRETIAEGHGLLKDLNRAQKQTQELITKTITLEVENNVRSVVLEHIRILEEDIKTVIEQKTTQIENHFQSLYDLFMDKERKLGEYDMETLFMARAMLNSLIRKQHANPAGTIIDAHHHVEKLASDILPPGLSRKKKGK